MSDTTKIQWANHTGGPWLVCSMVSAGCTNCYAMDLMRTRLGPLVRKAYKSAGFEDWETRPIWGDKASRVLSKGFWNDAVRLNAKHAKEGTRGRWFPSMIDWLDKMPAGIIDQDGAEIEPVSVLAEFLLLIHNTPHLDWLLLTKRPENFHTLIEKVIEWRRSTRRHDEVLSKWLDLWLVGKPPANVWIGVSVENQEQADKRIPELLKIPAKVRFLSCEPLLGEIDLDVAFDVCRDPQHGQMGDNHACPKTGEKVDWVIVGGESGKGARQCNIEWIRSIVEECKTAKVRVFVKQGGSNLFEGTVRVTTKDKKGGDLLELPEDLRIREFPALQREEHTKS